MTQFVIRDVGNVKLEDFENVSFTPNFFTREEVNEYLLMAEAYQVFKELKEIVSPLKCYDWFVEEDLLISTSPTSRPGKIYTKLVLKLAKLLEQHSFFIEALDIYRKISVTPARERQVRLMHRLNEPEEARALAEEILENPYNQSEALFAGDFLKSGTKRIKRSTTVSLKAADEILLVKDPQLSVEKQAVAYFRAEGYEAYHTENSLWRLLFGLLFWEETYDTDQSTFHHPLQRLPSDIHDQSFYEKRADSIEAKLRKIRTKKALVRKLVDTFEAKTGIVNQYVYWSEDLLDLAITAIDLLPLKGLKEVLKMISIQVKSNSTGFPDLFIFKGKKYHFYEIKSPTDQLSAQQLFWIDFMTKWNIKADVLKVGWAER
ncbi:MAG: VRR-NUC domain-containing protein [Cyclobacteriaceae bacterium]